MAADQVAGILGGVLTMLRTSPDIAVKALGGG
jgi:hypothetical protein